MGSFWECDGFCFDDLPTVRDLIWNADWDILSREASDEWLFQGDSARTAAVRKALGEMMRLEVREPSGKWVFFPLERFSPGGIVGCIDWGVDAALLRRSDLKVLEMLSEREEYLHCAGDCEKALERECGRLGDKYPDLHSWSSRSWQKVLSFRVWMRGEYSRKERYRVLADIVSEMMRYGDSWDEVRREKKRLKHNLRLSKESARASAPELGALELLMRDYGLESSTDDFESEFDKRMGAMILVLNYNASVDLHRRVADLMSRLRGDCT